MWEKKLQCLPIYCKTDTFSSITTDKTSKISKGPLNCNSKTVVYLSECKKCRNLYVGKAETKFSKRLNNYKSAHQSFKTKKQGTQNFFTDIIYRIIMKVRTIDNLQ